VYRQQSKGGPACCSLFLAEHHGTAYFSFICFVGYESEPRGIAGPVMKTKDRSTESERSSRIIVRASGKGRLHELSFGFGRQPLQEVTEMQFNSPDPRELYWIGNIACSVGTEAACSLGRSTCRGALETPRLETNSTAK